MVTDSVLDRLYKEKLAGDFYFAKENESHDAAYSKLIDSIEKRIVDTKVKQSLKKDLDTYLDALADIELRFHEKLYKAGVIDGATLLLDTPSCVAPCISKN